MPTLTQLLRSRTLRVLALALPLAAATACLSSKVETPPTIPVLTSVDTTTFATALGVDLAHSTKAADGVYYRDITAGTGTVVAQGKTATITYVGQLANGQTFDASVPGADPIAFVYGAHQVIVGLEDGMADMRVGGKRQIVIPPSVAYGAYDYRGIPGNSVLVFTITLVGVQ